MLKFLITDEQPPDVSKRKWRQWSRDAFAAIGTHFDSELKMKHFAPGAADRYGYRDRKAKYQASKRRKATSRILKVSPHAERPLIYTGALRRLVSMRHVPRSFPTRVSVNMPTPHYVQMRPKDPGAINLGEELVSVTKEEQSEMEVLYRDSVEADLVSFREPKTTTIG